MQTEEVNKFNDISIWVDKYEDLFSDFDSRDFTGRTLSDDFIMEVRKLVREMPSENIELKFNLMEEQRDPDTEAIIIHNIHEQFSYFAKIVQDEMKQVLRHGVILSVSGFLLIIFLIYLSNLATHGSLLNGVQVALEPVGWFLTWTGLDMIFQQSKKEKPTIDFNLKMARAQLTFSSFGVISNPEHPEETAVVSKVIPCGNNLRIAS